MNKTLRYVMPTAIFVIAVGILGCGHKAPATDNQIQQWQVEASAGATTNAFASLTKAAEAGQVPAQCALGLVYLQRGNHQAAFDWLTKAAKAGSSQSAAVLGRAYFRGSDGFEQSYPKALQWLIPSANKQDASAAYYLGLMYKSGYGVTADPVQAVHWFGIAADKQLPAGLFMLGNAYRYGQGVVRDEKRAVTLYQAAADLEMPEAIQTLMMAAHHGELGLHYDQEQDKNAMFEMGHAMKERLATP